jgi:peptidoglycan/xylan/chitin deacetylase (PgdA/CDA1 family)
MMTFVYKSLLGSVGAAARVSNMLRPAIFCFHSVQAANDRSFRSQLSVDDDFLENLIVSLRKLGIPVISIGDAVERLRSGDLRPFVVLTFDDGYADNYTTLYPLMRRLEAPFTIFVTTDLVDRTATMWWDMLERLMEGGAKLTPQPGDHTGDTGTRGGLTALLKRESASAQTRLLADMARAHPKIAHEPAGGAALSWQMLREMQASGLLTVGSHTMRHPMLGCLGVEEVEAELAGSRARLEEMLDIPVEFLAYPYGQDWEIGPHSAPSARRAGYKAAFSTEAVPLQADDADRPYLLPRILLSRKADHPDIALAYMSGLPARLNRMARRR